MLMRSCEDLHLIARQPRNPETRPGRRLYYRRRRHVRRLGPRDRCIACGFPAASRNRHGCGHHEFWGSVYSDCLEEGRSHARSVGSSGPITPCLGTACAKLRLYLGGFSKRIWPWCTTDRQSSSPITHRFLRQLHRGRNAASSRLRTPRNYPESLDLQPDVLLCRHPHRSFSQRRGRTRLLSNPAGYADENRYFDPLLTLELGHD